MINAGARFVVEFTSWDTAGNPECYLRLESGTEPHIIAVRPVVYAVVYAGVMINVYCCFLLYSYGLALLLTNFLLLLSYWRS